MNRAKSISVLRKRNVILYVALAFVIAASSGCMFLGSCVMPPENKSRVYYGVRSSTKLMGEAQREGKLVDGFLIGFLIIDLPFTFIGDSISLPFDLYNSSEIPPAVDPLLGWTKINESNFSLKNPAVAIEGVDSSEISAVSSFIQKHDVNFDDASRINKPNGLRLSSVEFYKDASGHTAAKIVADTTAPRETVTYILFLDGENKIKRTIKYRTRYYIHC